MGSYFDVSSSGGQPGQPGPGDQVADAKLKSVISDALNRTQKTTDFLSDKVANSAHAVEDMMMQLAREFDYTKIYETLKSLKAAMADTSAKGMQDLKRLTEQAKQADAFAHTTFQRVVEENEDLAFAKTKSFLPADTVLSKKKISSHIAQVSRLQDIVQGGDFTELFGKAAGPSAGRNLMARGLEGEVFKASQAMQLLVAETKRFNLSAPEVELRLKGIRDTFSKTISVALYGPVVGAREDARIVAQRHTGANQLRAAMPGFLARGMDKIPGMSGILASEESKAPQGYFAGVASAGLEKLVGTFGGVAGAVSITVAAIAKFIAILDEQRKMQGEAIPALTAGASTMSSAYVNFADAVMSDNKDIYSSLAYTKEFMPLVSQAFKTMSSIGYTSGRDTMAGNLALARSLMEVGIAGKGMGMEFGESMGLAATFTKALNLNDAQVGNYFNRYIALTKIAKQSMGDFGASIGDAMGYARQFGTSGADSIIDEMATRVHDLTDEATRLNAQGAFKSLLGMDLGRQAGLAMAMGGHSGLVRLETSGGNPLGVLTDSIGYLMKKISGGLAGKDEATRRLGIASGAGSLLENPAIAKALYNVQGPIEQSDLFRAITNQTGLSAKQNQALIDKAEAQFDPAQRGADSMNKATTTLDKILDILDNTLGKAARKMTNFGWANYHPEASSGRIENPFQQNIPR